jgi:hypothetical protein
VTESIKWKTPTFAYHGNIASFNPSKRLLSIMFHRGAEIPGDHPRLEGDGKLVRTMRFAGADPSCPSDASCLHRRCCTNPGHLEAVTHRENMHRSPNSLAAKNRLKTHCPHGHPYDKANTQVTPHGGRACRACNRAAQQRFRERVAAGAKLASPC